jgi:hypothetical protein
MKKCLRKTFETQRKKVSGGWGKLCDAGRHDFRINKYSLENNNKMNNKEME